VSGLGPPTNNYYGGKTRLAGWIANLARLHDPEAVCCP
jgi:hypothetical protein